VVWPTKPIGQTNPTSFLDWKPVGLVSEWNNWFGWLNNIISPKNLFISLFWGK